MDDEQFNDIIRSYEVRKKADKFIKSGIIQKNIDELYKIIQKINIELYVDKHKIT